MGCGSFTTSAYACYNSSLGREYDTTTLRASVKSVQEAYKQSECAKEGISNENP